jgi:hypothetical protein
LPFMDLSALVALDVMHDFSDGGEAAHPWPH